MPCQKEDRHLIDHLFGLEPLSGLRVGGGHDLGGQIVRRSACLDLRHPLGRQLGDQLADHLRGAFGLALAKARQPARQRHRGAPRFRIGWVR